MNIQYLSRSVLISDSANAVHVMKMCEAMSENGNTVTLHGLKGTGETNTDVYKYYNASDTKTFNLIRHNENDLFINKHLNTLKKHIPFLRIGGLPSLLYGYFKLNIPETDILFARNMYWLYAHKNKHNFIYESHSPPETKIHTHLEKQLFNSSNCKGIVVISDALKSIYTDIFPNIADKIIVAHDAAPEPPQADETIQTTLSRPIQNIGYVGHIYAGRGIEIIIETASALPELTFHIIGGRDDLIQSYKKTAPENLIFHGHQPFEKLADFYKSFDLVLAPYQSKVAVHGNKGDTAKFMSPLKLFEYMSWGIPMICSDLPVLHEVLTHEQNAMLATPDDPNAWIQTIKDLQNDQELRQHLAHTSRTDFLKNYTWAARSQFILSQATL